MNWLAETLRRARELHLERAHRFMNIPDWSALVLDASSGDREVAADALELLDSVTPGADAELLRLGAEKLKQVQRLGVERGLWPPEDPALRLYGAGLVFDFWALHGRSSAEVAAIIGKACVLAEAAATRRRSVTALAPREHEEAQSPPRPALVALDGVRRDAGYVVEPEEADEDDRR